MDLAEIIRHYRNRLSMLPDAPLYGDIPEGVDEIDGRLESFLTPEHKQFLLLCNGGSFGDIDLWNTEEILNEQYRVPESSQDSIYEIGQVLYEPIFLNRINNHVTFSVDKQRDIPFSIFVKEYMLGERYKYIFHNADMGDLWYSFLQDNPFKPE